jgi:hypothetical protein
LAKRGAEKAQLGVFGCSEANDPLEAGPGDVAQERGELLYHLLCYVFMFIDYVAVYMHLK